MRRQQPRCKQYRSVCLALRIAKKCKSRLPFPGSLYSHPDLPARRLGDLDAHAVTIAALVAFRFEKHDMELVDAISRTQIRIDACPPFEAGSFFDCHHPVLFCLSAPTWITYSQPTSVRPLCCAKVSTISSAKLDG